MFSTRPWNQLREECILKEPLASSFVEWKELSENVRPGDLIEFSSPSSSSDHSFKHWSVYEGMRNGVPHVIHYTQRGDRGKEQVKSEPLEHVADGRKGRKNNEWDERWDPLPQDEVIKRAEQMRSRSIELTSNEHFALECRYGERWMETVVMKPPLHCLKTIYEGTMVIMMLPVAVIIFSSLYWMGRLTEALKQRREKAEAKDD